MPGGKVFTGSVPQDGPEDLNLGASSIAQFMHPQENFGPRKLVVVVLAGVAASNASSKDGHRAVTIDESSLLDLTERVVDGHLTWDVPDDHDNYELLAFYQKYTNQRACDDDPGEASLFANGSWITDHFSSAGAHLAIDLMEHPPYNSTYVLSGDENPADNKYLQDGYNEYRATFESWAQSLNMTHSPQPGYHLPLDMVSASDLLLISYDLKSNKYCKSGSATAVGGPELESLAFPDIGHALQFVGGIHLGGSNIISSGAVVSSGIMRRKLSDANLPAQKYLRKGINAAVVTMRAPRQQTARRDLCPRCCRIDFNKVFHFDLKDLQANGQNGTLPERVRTPGDRNHPPDCALCAYIDNVNTSFDSSSQDLQLQLISTFGLARGGKKTVEWNRVPGALHAQDLPHLALISIGYASSPNSNPAFTLDVLSNAEFFFCIREHEQSRPVFQPQALAQQIDYASVAASLNFCKSKHKFLCNKGSDVAGLSRLIDCQASLDSIFIVPAQPGTPYLALSYVWGSSSNRKTTRDASESEKRGISGIPLSVLPRTISDAVMVLRNLGYRYLWVDKLCIDQDCAIEKHAQVSLMDQIYGGAEITIVAAAGSDSEHGLPGVSSTLRRTTQKSELDECQIVLTPRHPHHFIRNSTWASRAWTYQEALLSRRLLFFTESETYFECHSMQSRECMRYDLETLHCKQGKLYAYFNSPLFLKGISAFDSYIRASVPSLIRSHECIVEYTNRNMTYEADSLKAFMGIIKRLEKCKIPVFHLQGIPFLSQDWMDGTYKSLIAGLLWKHTKSPREASPPRRDSLPSWSWAGWEGEIRFFSNTRE
ncbi:hypothetical protein F66182_7148, partial [Fusarium sp. NRRL 66182]